MASSHSLFLLSLLVLSILLVNYTVNCDEEETLLRGINSYRATLNLTALTYDVRADCLADDLVDQFDNQPCTSTSGPNTVPGTEPQFANYPNILARCRLNVTTVRNWAIMPACVPRLFDANLVLSNYTETRYAGFLNDTRYTGVGINSDDDWVVVVLTTNMADGSFVTGPAPRPRPGPGPTPAPAPAPGSNARGNRTNSANSVSKMSLFCYAIFSLCSFLSLF